MYCYIIFDFNQDEFMHDPNGRSSELESKLDRVYFFLPDYFHLVK
jgi:hypothetical protein